MKLNQSSYGAIERRKDGDTLYWNTILRKGGPGIETFSGFQQIYSHLLQKAKENTVLAIQDHYDW